MQECSKSYLKYLIFFLFWLLLEKQSYLKCCNKGTTCLDCKCYFYVQRETLIIEVVMQIQLQSFTPKKNNNHLNVPKIPRL